MSEEMVQAYERAVEAANRRDFEAVVEECDPEVEWYPAVVGLGSEVYRGAEVIRARSGTTPAASHARGRWFETSRAHS